MSELNEIEREVAQLIVSSLNLEDVDPEKLLPDAPLFGGENGGLGLDSIDGLEIAMAVSKRYNIKLRVDDANNREIFRSLRTLAQHIGAHREPKPA